jgi:hypothetical protein
VRTRSRSPRYRTLVFGGASCQPKQPFELRWVSLSVRAREPGRLILTRVISRPQRGSRRSPEVRWAFAPGIAVSPRSALRACDRNAARLGPGLALRLGFIGLVEAARQSQFGSLRPSGSHLSSYRHMPPSLASPSHVAGPLSFDAIRTADPTTESNIVYTKVSIKASCASNTW